MFIMHFMSTICILNIRIDRTEQRVQIHIRRLRVMRMTGVCTFCRSSSSFSDKPTDSNLKLFKFKDNMVNNYGVRVIRVITLWSLL